MKGIKFVIGEGKALNFQKNPRKRLALDFCRICIIIWLVILLTSNGLLALSAAARSSEPNNKTFFEYEYKQSVDNCHGAYYGYSEETKGNGRYDVKSWGPAEAVFHVHNSWEYSNDDGGTSNGAVWILFLNTNMRQICTYHTHLLKNLKTKL